MLTADDMTRLRKAIGIKAAPQEEAPPLSLGRFLQMVALRDAPALHGHGCPYVSKAAMGTGAGATGGFLVTPELRMSAFKDAAEEAIVRPLAIVVPMAAAEVLLPLPDAQVAALAGRPPYFGGMNFQWASEGVQRPESEPLMRQLALKAWELTGELLCSNALLEDAPALEAALRQFLARAVGWFEDYAFFRGDGAGKPMGMVPASIVVTRSATATFANADASAMVEKLLPSSWPKAIWIVHPSTMVKVTALTNWQPNATRGPERGPAGQLHSLPLYVSDKLPVLGTQGDVLLCDPSLYAVGDRGLLIDASEHSRFRNAQTVFRVVARTGGAPLVNSDVTLSDGVKTARPYVTLSTL